MSEENKNIEGQGAEPVAKKENKIWAGVKKAGGAVYNFGKKIAKPVAFISVGVVGTKLVEAFFGNRYASCEEDVLEETETETETYDD